MVMGNYVHPLLTAKGGAFVCFHRAHSAHIVHIVHIVHRGDDMSTVYTHCIAGSN